MKLIRLNRRVEWKVWHLFLLGGVIGAAIAGLGVILVIGLGKLGDFAETNRQLSEANARSLANLRRIQRLSNPSDQDFIDGALRALRAIRSCANDPACRRRNPGVQRVNRAIGTGPIPRTVRQPDRRTGGSSGGSGGGGGSSTTPRPATPPPTQVRPPQQQPTSPARPPATTQAPRPSPPAATQPPATTRPPTTVVPPQTTPPVGPIPPVTTPPVTVPPVVPPITVPAPVQVCTPVITVGCRDPRTGRIVSAHAESDPDSSSGRGNKDDRLCDRLKVPCDQDGRPVFPPGLIRLP